MTKVKDLVDSADPDAMKWAEAFCEQYNTSEIYSNDFFADGAGGVGPGTMLAWFANYRGALEIHAQREKGADPESESFFNIERVRNTTRIAKINGDTVSSRRGGPGSAADWDIVINGDNIVIKNRFGPSNNPAEPWMLQRMQEID